MDKIYLKILIPSFLSISLFIITIFGFIIPRTQKHIMDGKREMITELTNSAWSILAKYETDERNGILSREEAQRTAISRIEYLRYGEGNLDYFWITDQHPRMIVHPFRRDLNDQDLTNFKDPNGKPLFVEFVHVTRETGSGFVNYMWQSKDDSVKIVPKLSFVRLFEPWGWIIGTGIYIDDVNLEIRAFTRRLIWISTGISVIIAFLLLFITQQSLKAEQNRVEAEKKLLESKERYRTLAEAATDGLVLLSEGRISFLNQVFCRISGFKESELIGQSFREMLTGISVKEIPEAFSGEKISEGNFDFTLIKKNGTFADVMITASEGSINGNQVTILIIKDVTSEKNSGLTLPEFQKLLNTGNIGSFRARVSGNGRFIYASENTMSLLGYDHFSQLSEIHFFDIFHFPEEKKNLRKELTENRYTRRKTVTVQKKNGALAIFSITLVLVNQETSPDPVFDGIMEDVTVQETEKVKRDELIASLKFSSFILEQPVTDYLTPLVTLDSDAPIRQAIKMVTIEKNGCLIITKNHGDFIGILTGSDLLNRVITLQLKPDNPVYLIMTSPLITTAEEELVAGALDICRKHAVNHLPVKNNGGKIIGLFNAREVYLRLKESVTFYRVNVEKAETTGQIKQLNQQFQLLLNPLIKSECSVRLINSLISEFSDAVIQKVIHLAIQEEGLPPVNFSFICLGSEGRKEETLLTDQDNAIIYDDVLPGKEKVAGEYFNRLGKSVCDALHQIGYHYCQGNVMAGNPQWCQPITSWEKYFVNWISEPEPQNLLDAAIFFDFRHVYGQEELANRLKEKLNAEIYGHPLFLLHLASLACKIKIPHFSAVSLLTDKTEETVELKQISGFFVMTARILALKDQIHVRNTLDRLEATRESGVFNHKTIEEMEFAFGHLMKIRFRNQVYQSENKLPVSNILNINLLTNPEISILKTVISLVPGYQKLLSGTFRISE